MYVFIDNDTHTKGNNLRIYTHIAIDQLCIYRCSTYYKIDIESKVKKASLIKFVEIINSGINVLFTI